MRVRFAVRPPTKRKAPSAILGSPQYGNNYKHKARGGAVYRND